MKKGVLFIALLLVMTNFAIAHICEGTDPSINGVFIDGQCYNCGFDEGGIGLADPPGICPEQFFVDCSANPDPDCAVTAPEAEAFLSLDNNTAIGTTSDTPLEMGIGGTTVYLVVINTGLANGEIVSFDIFEDDIIDQTLSTGEIQGVVQSGKVIGTFKINDESDLADGDYEDLYSIYFVATGTGLSETSGKEYVNATDAGIASSISTCGDYEDNVSCEDNDADVGISEGTFLSYGNPPREDCKRKESLVGCEWDSSTTTCVPKPTVIIYDSNNAADCDQTLTSCSYSESGKTECGVGEDAFVVSYAANSAGCESWTSAPIPCPQQLKVPFFGIYNFIISLVFISLIYVYLIFKKK